MRSHVVRQPVGLAVATFAAALFAGTLRAVSAPYPAEMAQALAMPLPELFDSLVPPGVWRYVFTLLAIIATAILVARITIAYKAVQGRSFIAPVMYALAAAGVILPFDSTAAPLAGLLLAASSEQAISSFRRKYRFGAVFNSAFMLGFIPLLYAPAVVLLPILAVTLVIYQRNMRETVTAVFALLLPFFLCSTGWWFADYRFGYIGAAFASELVSGYGLSVTDTFGSYYLPVLAFCTIYVSVLFLSAAMLARRYSRYGTRTRYIYLHSLLLLVLTGAAFFLPSASPAVSVSLSAIPASILASHLLANLKPGAALACYLILLGSFAAANIAPLL